MARGAGFGIFGQPEPAVLARIAQRQMQPARAGQKPVDIVQHHLAGLGQPVAQVGAAGDDEIIGTEDRQALAWRVGDRSVGHRQFHCQT